MDDSSLYSPKLDVTDSRSIVSMFHIDGLAYLPFPGHKDSHNTLPAATGHTSNPTGKIIILVNRNLSKTWDDYSGEPTIEVGTKKRHVNRTNTSFRKSTGSLSSNVSNGINGQSRPKQQLYRACHRLTDCNLHKFAVETHEIRSGFSVQ